MYKYYDTHCVCTMYIQYYILCSHNVYTLATIWITLPTKVRLVKAMIFPVVMYRYESWTVK